MSSEQDRVWGNDENKDETEGILRGTTIYNALINEDINYQSILDICCGRGFVLQGLYENLSGNPIGIGIDMVEYSTWKDYPHLIFIKTTFQDMCNILHYNVDIAVMLESWRRWDMLSDTGNKWRTELIQWLRAHAKYFICSEYLFELDAFPHKTIGRDFLALKGFHDLFLVTL